MKRTIAIQRVVIAVLTVSLLAVMARDRVAAADQFRLLEAALGGALLYLGVVTFQTGRAVWAQWGKDLPLSWKRRTTFAAGFDAAWGLLLMAHAVGTGDPTRAIHHQPGYLLAARLIFPALCLAGGLLGLAGLARPE